MTDRPHPVAARYLELLDPYLDGEVDDETFAQRFGETFLGEDEELPAEVFAPLDRLFYAVEAFDVFDPEREGTTSRAELRAACERARDTIAN